MSESTAIALNEAADQLGVHYQTAYRWVRTGRLPARLIAGKYVVEAGDLDAARTSRLTPSAPTPPTRRRLRSQAEVMDDALRRGDETIARQVTRTLVDEGTSIIDLVQEVIAPSLRSIGHDWHTGQLSIFVEHRASAIVDRVLGDVTPNRRGRRRGTAMVAAVAGDRHSLPTTMAAVSLRDANWAVHHLGADMPPDELLGFAASHALDVAVLSSTNPATADLAATTANRLERAGLPTVLGRPGATLDELIDQVSAVSRSQPA